VGRLRREGTPAEPAEKVGAISRPELREHLQGALAVHRDEARHESLGVFPRSGRPGRQDRADQSGHLIAIAHPVEYLDLDGSALQPGEVEAGPLVLLRSSSFSSAMASPTVTRASSHRGPCSMMAVIIWVIARRAM
jgi:hypothetical protein